MTLLLVGLEGWARAGDLDPGARGAVVLRRSREHGGNPTGRFGEGEVQRHSVGRNRARPRGTPPHGHPHTSGIASDTPPKTHTPTPPRSHERAEPRPRALHPATRTLRHSHAPRSPPFAVEAERVMRRHSCPRGSRVGWREGFCTLFLCAGGGGMCVAEERCGARWAAHEVGRCMGLSSTVKAGSGSERGGRVRGRAGAA